VTAGLVRALRRGAALALVACATASAPRAAAPQPAAVTHATLRNGLQVYVVRDTLAPAVTAVLTYRAGSDEQDLPGQAHALEHMMFRGSATVSASQLLDVSDILGGRANANTKSEATQYYFSVPAQYLDVALRLEASRARDLTLAQADWDVERGAIVNEVAQNESAASVRLFKRDLLPALFAGTPYAADTLGTRESFTRTIGAADLRAYYRRWYHPNNAVYVIAGDVDGPATVAAVRAHFERIPAAPLPARRPVQLAPVRAQTFRGESDASYTLAAVAYRVPGWSSPDYAAGRILEAVLGDRRGALYALAATGGALDVQCREIAAHPLAAAAALLIAVPAGADPDAAAASLRAVVARYRDGGVPDELVQAAKRRAIAASDGRADSIAGLAFAWADAVAVRGNDSPDRDLDAYAKVTKADVDRVLRAYLDDAHAVAAYAVAAASAPAGGPSGAAAPPDEQVRPAVVHHDPLPAWVARRLDRSRLPEPASRPADETLPNGLRLIVQPSAATHTVLVRGAVLANEAVQAPLGRDGVDDIMNLLFAYGTTTYDRVRYREQLDAIGAEAELGEQFALSVPSAQLERGIALLADGELHPALAPADFARVRASEAAALGGSASSPNRLATVALNRALYPPGDPLQRFPTPQSAAAVSLDDLRAYRDAVMRPDMTTIAVVGDVTPARARALVERYFGDWHGTGPRPDVILPPVPPNAGSELRLRDRARGQSQLRLVQVSGLTRDAPDWAAVRLGTAMLGGGPSSALARELRERRGLVYGVASRLSTFVHRSVFSIDLAADPQRLGTARELALAQLARMLDEPVAPAELDRAKAMLLSEVPLQISSYEGVARRSIESAQFGLPLDQDARDAQRFLSATPAGVRGAMARWVRPRDFVAVVREPAAP
jgi:zinc protease